MADGPGLLNCAVRRDFLLLTEIWPYGFSWELKHKLSLESDLKSPLIWVTTICTMICTYFLLFPATCVSLPILPFLLNLYYFICWEPTLTWRSCLSRQCVLFIANIGHAPKMESAAMISAWAAAWNQTQPVSAWPAGASGMRAAAWKAVPKTTSSSRAGAVSHFTSARTITATARALTAHSTSSTMVPASLSVPLATPPSTPPRKCTLESVWWDVDGLQGRCAVCEKHRSIYRVWCRNLSTDWFPDSLQ